MIKASTPRQKTMTYRGKLYTKVAAYSKKVAATDDAELARRMRVGALVVDLGATSKKRYAVFQRGKGLWK